MTRHNEDLYVGEFPRLDVWRGPYPPEHIDQTIHLTEAQPPSDPLAEFCEALRTRKFKSKIQGPNGEPLEEY